MHTAAADDAKDEYSINVAAQDVMVERGLSRAVHLLEIHLQNAPRDQEARCTLGIVQFLRAVEELGAGMYQYGVRTNLTNAMFVRLPVPENPQPAEINYRAFLRLIDGFSTDLMEAEKNLALIDDYKLKVPFNLSKVAFRFGGPNQEATKLFEVISKLRGTAFSAPQNNPELLIKFDRGDVAWLRAYCHLLSGLIDVYHAYDSKEWFDGFAGRVFPRVLDELSDVELDDLMEVRLVDPIRMNHFKQHFLAVCDLNAETWRHIRAETDDDYEWLPHPKQTDQLGMPFSDDQINNWLFMMEHVRGVLEGERLIPSTILMYLVPGKHEGNGFNVAKFLDDPPRNLNYERIVAEGIEPKYLEPEEGRELVDVMALVRIGMAFSGPFGPLQALRLN